MAGRLFHDKTVDQQTSTLQSFLPGGRPFLAAGIDIANLRKLLIGLATEMNRVENLMNEITYEHEIDQTTLLIDEWEHALGLPDACFPVATTLEERRQNCIAKLAFGVQTEADFVQIGKILGLNITITQGSCYGMFPFPCTLPAAIEDFPQSVRFRWRILITGSIIPCRFPFLTLFPICFSDTRVSYVECLFNRLRPANTIFDYVYDSYNIT